MYFKRDEIEKYKLEGWNIGCLFRQKENSPYSKKRIWLTNGKENRYVIPELIDEILLLLEGWRKGKTYSESAKLKFKEMNTKMDRTANVNAVKKRISGTIYITNGKENLRLQPEDAKSYLENGWRRGRWQPAWNKK